MTTTPQKPQTFLKKVLKHWYIHLFLWPISLPIVYLIHVKQNNTGNEIKLKLTEGKKYTSSFFGQNQKWRKSILTWVIVSFIATFAMILVFDPTDDVSEQNQEQDDQTVDSSEDDDLSPSEQLKKTSQEISEMLLEMNGGEPIHIPYAVDYEIVQTEDMSHKAMDGPLSSYTTAEIEQLPIDKKISYKVVVSPEIKEDEVRPTVGKIIIKLTEADPEIDEIILFLYSDPELIEESYDVATATWAPYGELGNITPQIALNNDRNDYKTNIQIKEDLEKYLSQRNTSEEKFGLSEDQRREIFKAIVISQDSALEKAEADMPLIDVSDPGYSNDVYMAQLMEQREYERGLQETYRKEVLAQFGLDEEVAKQIELEAYEEGWPMVFN